MRTRFQAHTLAAYLGACVRNEALARLRSASRRKAIVRRLPVNDVVEDELRDPVAIARVRAALEALPPEQRTAIRLVYEDGLTHREIAERLGKPLGTVKSRISLGVRKLQGLLSAQREVQ